MRGSLNRWSVALKIARRSALRSWGRSLLIVVLIAAPITGLSAAAVLLPSTQSTLDERIQNTLGHAQAVLTVEGRPSDRLQQGIEGGYDYASRGDGNGEDDYVDPRTVLAAGTRVLAIGAGAGVFATPTGSTSLQVVTGPSWDPSLDGGPYQLLSGRRPTAEDEVLVSPAALTRLGAHVGGTVSLTQPEVRTLRVVGTSRDRSAASYSQTVFAATALFTPDPSAPNPFVYYVTSTPIDWPTVERLNAAGTTVFSRVVLADPPVLPADRTYGRGSDLNPATAALVAIAIMFAVLEVALLAGAAFLVGARLQQRSLATVASVGADRSVLRRIVTASGVVLGAIGGTIGVALGIGGALLVMRLTDDGSSSRYPGVHLLWPLLIGIAVFGVVVGWIAALLPARAASRFDIVRALRGARTPQRVGKRPVAGVVLLVIGITCTLLGTGALVAALKLPGGDAGTWAQLGALALLGGGPVVAQLGVVLCAGLLLRGITRLLRTAPLAARLAARDTSRNLGRAVPAVASVMTTVFVAAFAMCVANTASQQAAIGYYWQAAAPGDAVSSIAWSGSHRPTTAQAETWLATIRRTLPLAGAGAVRVTPQSSDDDKPSGRRHDAMPIVRFRPRAACGASERRDPKDSQCGPFSAAGGAGVNAQPDVTVGDAGTLGLLLGHAPSAAALRSLAAGGAVALRADVAPSGTASLDWYTPKQLAEDVSTVKPIRTTRLNAVTDLPTNPIQDSLFTTVATAKALGLTSFPDRVVMTFSRTPTNGELDAANAALGAIANQPGQDQVTIETGPQDLGSLIAWYVLLACLVIAIAAGATAIGLARVDGRPDDLTLASLGAAPRIRRAVAFVQALIVCGLGALLGTVLGMLPALALGGATTSFPFSPPPVQLMLLAVGIPVMIAVGSYLLVGTRRADLTRRTAIA